MNLLAFARGIANGLTFLATKDVVHGDLAARNILLTDQLVVKISDFGLSKRLEENTIYVKNPREIPLLFKWLAIETLTDLKFSLQSDIWSYGVTRYEIFSLGESPFPGCQWNSDFVDRIIAGYRMKKPQYADDEMYEIMTECWHKDPNERATSSVIYYKICRLETMLGKAGV